MNSADVIAYVADADVVCPDCAKELYGLAAMGICRECKKRGYQSYLRHRGLKLAKRKLRHPALSSTLVYEDLYFERKRELLERARVV
jgi:hypothetical protein